MSSSVIPSYHVPMLSAHPHIQTQLSEALTIISKHDFSQTLLLEIVTNLQLFVDYTIINGILILQIQSYRGFVTNVRAMIDLLILNIALAQGFPSYRDQRCMQIDKIQ
jgi:hypothetical protein